MKYATFIDLPALTDWHRQMSPMNLSPHPRATAIIVRLTRLLGVLRDGPISRADLLLRLGTTYPFSPSARRMLDRDLEHLAALGITIERSRDSPPRYTLQGCTPVLSDDELRALALVRDSFGPGHPQAPRLQALVERLTAQLNERQLQIYARRQALRAPLQPAIDYTPYATLIEQLERAIATRRILRFSYSSSRGRRTIHRRVEPHEIEYHERHFYLAGYSHNSGQFHDFRIDRISDLAVLERLPPEMGHTREPVVFRYRLTADLARGELSRRFDEQRIVERLEHGDLIIEAQGRSGFFIIQSLLRYRANAELLEPAWLREQMRNEVAALARLYGE